MKNVGVNETRAGIIDVLAAMGADMTMIVEDENAAEPTATITIRTSNLAGTTIEGDDYPTFNR